MIATGYDREVYESADRILRERRRAAEAKAERSRTVFYGVCPGAQELERRLAATAVAAARAVLGGGNAREQLGQLREQNRALREELSALLRKANLSEEDLEPQYSCPLCGDTGYVDGKMCACLKKLLREEAYNRLNALTPLSLSTFEDFSLDYYSEEPVNGSGRSQKSVMKEILSNCIRYAETFSQSSRNLLLQGETGLGKTHLSLAIASEVLQKGFGVVYCSVNSLISRMENEHFNRGEDSGDTGSLLESCDLLILDDLGTEFRSSFSVATIYSIVNSRLLLRHPTIISTNLSINDLRERYSDRFASRIGGDFIRLMFTGHDNRVQKLFQRYKN